MSLREMLMSPFSEDMPYSIRTLFGDGGDLLVDGRLPLFTEELVLIVPHATRFSLGTEWLLRPPSSAPLPRHPQQGCVHVALYHGLGVNLSPDSFSALHGSNAGEKMAANA